jgi:hypothetical protein
VQEDIMAQNPTESISVLVVWFHVLGPDSANEVDPTLLSDARATNYWDGDLDVSEFLNANATEVGIDRVDLLWDAYLLFGQDAEWEDAPTPLISWGAPVINSLDELTARLEELWASA